MTTFRVGQRVKKIANPNNPICRAVVPLGSQGVIVGVNVIDPKNGNKLDYRVDYGFPAPTYAFHYQLEPILGSDSANKYDGNSIVLWESFDAPLRDVLKRIRERENEHA